ncbi:hypothetical protein EHQ81_08470 [Leptospira selangorensis]|uniref:Uncharacterized protein n=1 Tax=Leptospira selangorensis TaxID=2484982 RepID=A0A5F2BXV0_9LEPT|nr:hypothetical protein [Leptospira selangorensis]TGM14207.1 hypothetical protein EHQ81_08470 [Leptospira selangorensis]TGM16890.1 hypothetical protein EHQ82_16835 [Leptospira selangorensis]
MKYIKVSIEKSKIDIVFNEIFYRKHENISYSYLFKSQIYLLYNLNCLPDFIFRESIDDIAKDNNSPEMKGDSQFENAPLVGLWKKHYFLPEHISHNLLSEILNPRNSTNRQIDALFNKFIGRPFQEIIGEFANLLTVGALKNRSLENRKTGEWIIYAKIDQHKYILTLANHREGKNRKESDLNIYKRISKICFDEFPELIKG